MKMRFLLVALVLVTVLPLGWQTAQAVPSFARADKMDCRGCHTIFPQLNDHGRLYKEGNYSFVQPLDLGDGQVIEGTFPGSARLNMRLIDKRTSRGKDAVALSDKDKQLKMRAFHELEVFLAGNAAKKWSFFAELEAEDEWADPAGLAPGYQIQVASGVVGYDLGKGATFHAGYGSPFWADPYNTVNYRKPVRHDWAPVAVGFMPGSSQFISFSGRVAEKVFLLGAWHGNSGALEGNDPRDFSLRAAFDVTPAFSIGAFGTVSKAYDSGTGKSEDKTTLYGADFQAAVQQANFHGLFGVRKDDVSDTQETTFGLEGNVLAEVSGTLVGPVVSVSSYTENDGEDRYTMAGIFLNCQVSNNVRTQFGWEGELSVPEDPDGDPDTTRFKESRLTLVVDIGI